MQRSLKTKTAIDGDFRLFLQTELLEHCRKNPSYSLRSFARKLKVNPATLSHLLRGNRPITAATRTKLALAMGLTPEEISRFEASTPLKFQPLVLDQYATVAEWHHDAILELTRVRGFRSDAKWIAKRLGLTASEVNIAIERLLRLGILSKSPGGELKPCDQDMSTVAVTQELTSAALRTYQKAILEKSSAAVDSVPLERRSHTSMTMAIDPRDLAEAKERIKKFRRELCEFLQREGVVPLQVYQLGIGLFPLTQDQGESV